MVASLLIFWNVLITTILADTILHCNDECLLSKLQVNGAMQKTHIILSSYNISNNMYMDSASIWIHPCQYFSNTFLQKFTSQKHPANNDFRQIFYNKYIAANNLSLILQINSNNNLKDNNMNYLRHIISKYRFDGYMYIPNSNNKISKNKRVLLGGNNGYTSPQSEAFDVLNQHTWDEYDWFLYAFSLCSFGSCCLCCGWCTHKKYIADKVVEDEDIDELEVPISPDTPSQNNSQKKMSFAGFNIFGDKIESPNDSEYNEHMTPTLQSMTNHMHNMTYRTSNISEMELNQLQPVSSNTNNKIDPRLLHQLQIQQTPTFTHSQNTNVETPVIYQTENAMVKIVSPSLSALQSVEPRKSSSFIPSRISLPTETSSIVPKYKLDNPNLKSPQTLGIDAVASPDSCETSESHISIDMFLKRINSSGSELQAIGYTPTDIHQQTSGSENNPFANIEEENDEKNNVSPIPLNKIQSIQLNGLDIINEGNEHEHGHANVNVQVADPSPSDK